MPNYAYQSMDVGGKIVRGTMDAANLPDLEMRLKRMELDLIDVRIVQRGRIVLGGRRRITRKDLINFCFQMEQLTAAGVPILDGLSDLRDTIEHPRFRELVADLIEAIEGGLQLSAALQRHPEVFDRTFVSLIMAGERTGNIPEVLKKLTDSLKWQDELASQAKKILSYPLFVGTILLGVTFFLMIYLVPQLTSFITMMGETLPFHTRALIAVSNFFVAWWYAILIAPVAAAFVLAVLLKTSARVRYAVDDLKLRLPLVGGVLRRIIMARFATFFSMMYAAGIPVLEAIEISEEIVANQVVAGGLQRARVLISEGQSVTSSFEYTGMFPPLVIRMLKVGEATGSLDASMRNVSYFYDREVKELIDQAQAAIGPALTVVMGLLLGWVMMSVLGPIYDIISKMKT